LAKIRVYELAKKLDVTSEVILKVLEKAGIVVKSHMSGLDNDAVVVVEKDLKSGKAPAKKTAKAKKAAPAVKTAKTKAKTKPKAKVSTADKKDKPAPKKKPKTSQKTAPKEVPSGKKDKPAAPPAPPKKSFKGKPQTKPAPARDVKDIQKGRKPKPPRPPKRRPQSDVEAQQKAVRESVRRTLAKIEVTRRNWTSPPPSNRTWTRMSSS